MFDAFERDMIDALATGRGADVGADRQCLRRALSDPLAVCTVHRDRPSLEQAVLIELRGTGTDRTWHLLLCAEAFDDPDRQLTLHKAVESPALTVTVYDGRQLFGAAPRPLPDDASGDPA